jgi:hypothetical protein
MCESLYTNLSKNDQYFLLKLAKENTRKKKAIVTPHDQAFIRAL